MIDLFEGIDADDSLTSAVAEIESADSLSDLEGNDAFPDVVVECGSVDFFSLAVLTVPDVDRIGIPGRFSESKVPVDLAGLAEMSWGSVRKLIMPSLPDEQLAEIERVERSREKTRAKVLDAIEAEWADRGTGFFDWVMQMSANPFAARVVAVAWRAGRDGSIESVACVDDDAEREAFRALRDAWGGWKVESPPGFAVIAGFGVDAALRLLRVRAAGVGLLEPFWDWSPVRVLDCGEYLSAIDKVGGLVAASQAIGVADADMPAVPGGLDVWRAWRSGSGEILLSDWCAGKLQLEAELIGVVGDV